jgi:hypothetical protein
VVYTVHLNRIFALIYTDSIELVSALCMLQHTYYVSAIISFLTHIASHRIASSHNCHFSCAPRSINTEHIEFFRSKYSQYQLQDCFYALYDAEVATVLSAFLSVKGLTKKDIKTINAFARTFLLDKLELNVKSRCVFSWSGEDKKACHIIVSLFLLCFDLNSISYTWESR